MCRSPRVRSAVSEVLDGTVHLKTGPASVTSSSAQSPDSSPPLESTGGAPSFSPAQLTPLRVASNKSWHAEMVQLSDQGVTGLGDEESTAIGWLTAAVQKCARALDLARCLEGTLIGDGRALTI